MRRRRWLAPLVVGAAVALAAALAQGYSDPQLARGLEVYAGKCIHCHGASGDGTAAAPPHRGASFLAKFETAADLALFIRFSMPLDNPGSLTDEEVWAVVARILALNGVEPDGQLLNSAQARRILLASRAEELASRSSAGEPAPPPPDTAEGGVQPPAPAEPGAPAAGGEEQPPPSDVAPPQAVPEPQPAQAEAAPVATPDTPDTTDTAPTADAGSEPAAPEAEAAPQDQPAVPAPPAAGGTAEAQATEPVAATATPLTPARPGGPTTTAWRGWAVTLLAGMVLMGLWLRRRWRR